MYDFATFIQRDRRDLLGLQARPTATDTNHPDYVTWVKHQQLVVDALRRDRDNRRHERALRRAAKLRRRAQRSQERASGAELRANRLAHS